MSKIQEKFDNKCEKLEEAICCNPEYYYIKRQDKSINYLEYEEYNEYKIGDPYSYCYSTPIDESVLQMDKNRNMRQREIIDKFIDNKYFTKTELLAFAIDFYETNVQKLYEMEKEYGLSVEEHYSRFQKWKNRYKNESNISNVPDTKL